MSKKYKIIPTLLTFVIFISFVASVFAKENTGMPSNTKTKNMTANTSNNTKSKGKIHKKNKKTNKTKDQENEN